MGSLFTDAQLFIEYVEITISRSILKRQGDLKKSRGHFFLYYTLVFFR